MIISYMQIGTMVDSAGCGVGQETDFWAGCGVGQETELWLVQYER